MTCFCSRDNDEPIPNKHAIVSPGCMLCLLIVHHILLFGTIWYSMTKACRCRAMHAVVHMASMPTSCQFLLIKSYNEWLDLTSFSLCKLAGRLHRLFIQLADFLRRGSLYQLLHSPSAYLTWQQLVGICLATAQGMLHLHLHQALHRDLKSGQL